MLVCREHSLSGHARVGASADVDKAGITASLICAAHCAIMPIAIAFSPIASFGIIAHAATEYVLITASFALATFTLCLGYRRHKAKRVILLLFIGVTMLLSSRLAVQQHFGWLAPVAAVLGGLAIAAGHLVNLKLCRRSERCHSADRANRKIDSAKGSGSCLKF